MKVNLDRTGGIDSFFGLRAGDVLVNADGSIHHIPLEEFKVLYNEPIDARTSHTLSVFEI